MPTKIFIDADGCPVVDITVKVAKQNSIECFILCDTSHEFNKEGATTLTFSKGADSVDFALVNLVKSGDIVITQDYGLAAMCLAKKTTVLNQNGMLYTNDNIDSLLEYRHKAKKILRSGGRLKAIPKRTAEQNEEFESKLKLIISSIIA